MAMDDCPVLMNNVVQNCQWTELKYVHGIVTLLYQATRGESARIQSSYVNIDDFESQTVQFNLTVLNDGYKRWPEIL